MLEEKQLGEAGKWKVLPEKSGGELQHVSWFPCGSNPLILTDKDLINTRLCDHCFIKIIWPLVWMSSQDAGRGGAKGTRCPLSCLNLMLHFPNLSSHHVLMKASNELLGLFDLTTHLLFIGNAEASSGAAWNSKQAWWRHSPLQITLNLNFPVRQKERKR